MITLAEAERIATGWAEKESMWRGYPCTPHVDELALGYAVWMRLPPDVRTEPGQDVTTVIDRATGRLSHWPPAPLDELDQRYSERRDAAVGSHQTADPVAELWREAFRRVSPAVAAHLTLGGRLFRARGAKGDQELRHHPIVARLLGAVPRGGLVRGADRHAELLVVSDVLFEADRARTSGGQEPLTLDEAGHLLQQGLFETFHIRESGDPLGGQPAALCATCSDLLLALRVIAAEERTYVEAQRLTSGDDPVPGLFPAEVAWELAAGGWDLGTIEERAREGVETVVGIEITEGSEFTMRLFDAARDAYVEFYRVAPRRNGPGRAQRVREFAIGGGSIQHLADPLAEFGIILDAQVFPLGVEGADEAVLVIDDRGRVFALDQGGEWFIADTVHEALVALLTGRPAARVRNDGTWETA
ncbi:hypothetical protein GCM10010172_24250 [Paractinoplanes ferrugineus]|uniref:SUKH-3 immunity protein of toxin-antitoxin system n=1 Tax=Paractinoplanes ferrugineus TaxID=113564 RepID=A0A919IXU8_9ACTN|nr:SUKH-3 domain-containing protein [Actinoplanes ferrugineus]GIE08664.1 hypothetical protein Afe05nite_05040 [Actinoplanes ferrugineus]